MLGQKMLRQAGEYLVVGRIGPLGRSLETSDHWFTSNDTLLVKWQGGFNWVAVAENGAQNRLRYQNDAATFIRQSNISQPTKQILQFFALKHASAPTLPPPPSTSWIWKRWRVKRKMVSSTLGHSRTPFSSAPLFCSLPSCYLNPESRRKHRENREASWALKGAWPDIVGGPNDALPK